MRVGLADERIIDLTYTMYFFGRDTILAASTDPGARPGFESYVCHMH